jgi:formate C-acetyltransferase
MVERDGGAVTPLVRSLRDMIMVEKRHHASRRDALPEMAPGFSARGLSPMRRMAERLAAVLDAEEPTILPGERIVLTRTVPRLPALFTDEEERERRQGSFVHERGTVSNISPDYASTIAVGLEKRAADAHASLERCAKAGDREGEEFLQAVLDSIAAVLRLAERDREACLRADRPDIASVLERVPRYGARTLLEAMQSFRFLHFALWAEGEYHNTVGRLDQYFLPYFEADMAAGRLDRESALELVEEFFLTFNRDSDLYPGVQQGDNGQSLVLGGLDSAGKDAFNDLSRLCLEASRELKVIDPKINLRVHAATSNEVFALGTRLTKEGLGFPQYSNDEVVIPGLVALGYEPEDARDYVVAACWEFIIPGKGMDIPNIAALSFPKVVDAVMRSSLGSSGDFDAFLAATKEGVRAEARRLAASVAHLAILPAPFMSLLVEGRIEAGRDVSLGAKYNNYGIHGAGLSTAVDSLAAVSKYVFQERRVTPQELVRSVDADFEGSPALLHDLRFEGPKLGNGDPLTCRLATELLDAFAEALEGLRNERGGRFRAGTGSAMYYLWHARELGASPDGRRKGEPFSANCSPSIFARVKGPISIIRSFASPALSRTINGGPLTLEFHASAFRDEECLEKVASLVKSFFDLGGHQLQLNAVDREALIDAQKRPEAHRGLIVRVWGWSAYFVELDREYQDHIIRRQEYEV